jgi:hypothetical protein
MQRPIILVLVLLAGCVRAPVQSSGQASTVDSFSTTSESCFTDTDCPGGSCRLGECSPRPPDPPQPAGPPTPTLGTPCTSGFNCSDNICQGADCQ